MSIEQKIRKAIAAHKPAAEVQAGQVWKGWGAATHKEGWHWKPFNGQEVFLGANEKEALAQVEAKYGR